MFKADSHIVSSAHGKLVQIAEQMKMLQKQAEDCLRKAKEDQMLAHAACNFEKKCGQIYHLYKYVSLNSGSNLLSGNALRFSLQ